MTAPSSSISFSFPSDHLEQLTQGVSALTIDPYKNALYYFFPFIGAFFAPYQELRSDPAQEAMMPKDPTKKIFKEIKDLTHCAGIQREVIPYIALNHQFTSYGGSYSLTKPALFLPDQHLFRRNGLPSFGAQQHPFKKNIWVFSDDETRFLIARELGQMKENSALVRLAIKVSVLAALFTIYTSPCGWPLGIALFIGVLGLYIVSEQLFQARADVIGTQILAKKTQKPKEAIQIAIGVFEKMREQNLYRRQNSALARLYITASGNNVLDFTHSFLTTRITRLRECAKRNL